MYYSLCLQNDAYGSIDKKLIIKTNMPQYEVEEKNEQFMNLIIKDNKTVADAFAEVFSSTDAQIIDVIPVTYFY